AWFAEVAALPADRQVEAVTARLKERNPGFDGPVTPRIEDGVVTEVMFLTYHVTDLTPLQALPWLRKLECRGTDNRRGRLADLSPLKGMKLTELDCSNTYVSDLSPLVDMKLALLDIGNTDVSDLS